MPTQRAQPAGSPLAHVLVVDDSKDSVDIVRQVLESRGFAVTTAHDGESALRAVEERRPDLVLLDVMMPQMSGLEVLDRLRSDVRHASIPVILLTAKAQDQDVLAGYRFGADYYITKPFTPRQVLYGIGLVLGLEIAD
jgi:DNA-binding response OmpR family regulator